MMSDSTALMNQTATIFQTFMFISVASMHGTNAEKKMMHDTDITAVMNLISIAASATNREGRNISMMDTVTASASSGTSSRGNSQSTG